MQRHKLEREIGELNRTKRRQAIQHSREVRDFVLGDLKDVSWYLG